MRPLIPGARGALAEGWPSGDDLAHGVILGALVRRVTGAPGTRWSPGSEAGGPVLTLAQTQCGEGHGVRAENPGVVAVWGGVWLMP